jgi:hypothetical protein
MYEHPVQPYLTSIIDGLDEEIRQSLLADSNWYLHLLIGFTVLLFVGVIVEEFAEHFPVRYRVNLITGVPYVRFHTGRWIPKVKKVGILMAVLGIAGEGLGEYFAAWSNDIVVDFDRALITGSQVEAALANQRATQLNIDLEAERKNSRNAQAILTDSQHQLVSNLAVEAAKQRAAERSLESEKRKRVELAASLLPRDFWNQSGAISKLAGLPVMKVVFEFTDEGEPRRTAEQINNVLNFVHWTAVRRCTTESIDDGVTIWPPGLRPEEARIIVPLLQQATDIADALRDALNDSGIESRVRPTGPVENIPLDTLIVRIGAKPNREAEGALKELGPPPKATPLGGITMSNNRLGISWEKEPATCRP